MFQLNDIAHSERPFSLLNNFYRALLCALAAVRTLLIIDNSYIIVHVNGIKLTLLSAESTADTPHVTFGLYILAFIMGVALYQMLCLVRNQVDQLLRAG